MIENPAYRSRTPGAVPDPNLPPTIPKIIKGSVVKEYVGTAPSVGPYTKSRLDSVLKQLNDKILIQTLRR